MIFFVFFFSPILFFYFELVLVSAVCLPCKSLTCSFVILHFGNAESFKVVIERDGGEGLGKLCHVIYISYIIFSV